MELMTPAETLKRVHAIQSDVSDRKARTPGTSEWGPREQQHRDDLQAIWEALDDLANELAYGSN